MTLKILIFAAYPSPTGITYGGIQRAVRNTVNELYKLDRSIEIHICTLTSEVDIDKIEIIENLFIHYIRFPLASYPILVPSLLTQRIVNREIKKINPDIIHVHGVGKYYAYPITKIKFEPTIITVHGVIHQESKTWNGLLGNYRCIVGRSLEDYILKNAKYIVAVSPYVKNIIEPITKGDISVIYNPFDSKFFNFQKEEIDNRILFVGGIEPRKGLHVLIEAIKIVKLNIPHIRLHIVGGIRKKDYYIKILKKIKEYDLLDNIIFKGMVTDEKLSKEYSEAAIFILPSEEESLGIVLLEAMITGTAIIASDIGGIPYIVRDGSNGFLVKFGDYVKMAEHILNLLSHKKLRISMGISGKDMAGQFQSKKIAMEYLQIYQKIAHLHKII